MTMHAADFTNPATDGQLDALAERLRERNFEVVVVDTGEEAAAEALKRLPEGAEVHSAKSKTIEDIGLFKALSEGPYNFLRKQLFAMDRNTQAREMRKLVAAPDYELGSVQAITEAGQMVEASASGSQMGPYSASSGHLILIVGSQKLVPDLEAALRRVNDHVFPYEDARLQKEMARSTKVCRILIIERDYVPGHTTVILVRQPVGV